MQNLKDLKNIIEKKLKESNNVFITFHSCVDIDAIASAIGLSYIFKKIEKNPYIILNDNYDNIEKGAKKIINVENKNYNIISMDIFMV